MRLRLLILLFSSLDGVRSSCDDDSTIVIPVQSVELANGDKMKGVPVAAGTPGQTISCLPMAYFNDTWIYNSTATFCQETTSLQCQTLRGGLYDGSASSTRQGPMSVKAAGGDVSDVQRTLMPHVWINSFVTDSFAIGASTLDAFPIGMPGFQLDTAYDTQCELGVGRASVLLNSLLEAKKIASRSFSWWWGIETATGSGSMDGQMVLGGLDEAKVKGQNYTASLTTPSTSCITGMLVTITDIILGFTNGTTSSIVKPGTISACLMPDFPLIITLPWTPYFANFESTTHSSSNDRSFNDGIGFYGMLYSPDAVFDGDMTIQFSNGLQIPFPNDLLVVPPSSVMSDGSLQKNESIRELLINPTLQGNEGDTAILGRHFFQSAYLTVDYDANIFTLSQSNPTTDKKIKALGSGCNAVGSNRSKDVQVTTSSSSSIKGISTSSSTHTATITSHGHTYTTTLVTNSSTTHSSLSHSSSAQSSFPIAVLIGAVVGSMLGIIGLVCIALFLWRRRRPRGRNNLDKTDSSIDLTDHRFSAPSASQPSSIFEMRAEGDPHELLPESKPQELATAPWNRPLRSPAELATARWTRLASPARSPAELW